MVWGAIAGFLSSQVIGALWYAPFVAGSTWVKATYPGKKPEQVGQGMGIAYLFTLVSSATLALLLQFILTTFLKVTSVEVAIKASLGLAALCTLVDIPHLCFARRSVVGFLIDHVFDAMVLAINGAAVVYFS